MDNEIGREAQGNCLYIQDTLHIAEAAALGLSPEEAMKLGGTAVLSTHRDGKPTRRLVFNILAQGLATSAPFFAAAAFLALVLDLRSTVLNEAMGPLRLLVFGLLAAGAVAFVAPVAWGLRPETVEMSPETLRIRTANETREIPWAAVTEIRATTFVSFVSLRLVIARPAVMVTGGTGTYIMKWWRFPIEDQRQFFNYAASRVLPANVPVIDDLHWLPAEKASHPAVSSGWVREYNLAVRVGLAVALAGLFPLVGFFVDVPLAGAVGAAMMFIGLFSAVLGWSALSEEKKKREQT